MIFETLSYYQYRDKRWRQPQTLDFIAAMPRIGLIQSDLQGMALVAPIAFIQQTEGWQAVLLNQDGFNAVSDPKRRWNGHRLPATLALYPFSVVYQGRLGQHVLGIARDPEVIASDFGEPFFEPEGPLTHRLQVAHRRLGMVEAAKATLRTRATWLAQAEVLEPMPRTPLSRLPLWVVSVKKLDSILQRDDLTSEILELAYAAAFSLRGLAPAFLQQLEGYAPRPCKALWPENLGQTDHLDGREEREASGKPASPSYLSDDDTLAFTFTSRGGLFDAG